MFQLGLKYNTRIRKDEQKQNNEFVIIERVVDLEIYTYYMPDGQTGYNDSFLHGVNTPIANPTVKSPRCLEIKPVRKTEPQMPKAL